MNCSEKEGDRSSDSKLVAMGYRTNMHYYVICLIISEGVMESHIWIYRPMVRWGVAKAASLQIVCAQLEKAPIHPSHCASAYVAFTSPALYFWCHLKMPLGNSSQSAFHLWCSGLITQQERTLVWALSFSEGSRDVLIWCRRSSSVAQLWGNIAIPRTKLHKRYTRNSELTTQCSWAHWISSNPVSYNWNLSAISETLCCVRHMFKPEDVHINAMNEFLKKYKVQILPRDSTGHLFLYPDVPTGAAGTWGVALCQISRPSCSPEMENIQNEEGWFSPQQV